MAHAEGFQKLVADAKKNVKECTVDDVLAKRKSGHKFHFVDVREDDEWKAGRAQGAIHLGKGVIERDIETDIPDRDAEIILYCGGGFRSALAAESIQKMGYRNVISMDGGWRGWTGRVCPRYGYGGGQDKTTYFTAWFVAKVARPPRWREFFAEEEKYRRVPR